MLTVETFLEQKKDGSVGLFAGQDILAHQKIFKAESTLTRWFYHQQIINDGLLDFFCRYAIYSDDKGAWQLFGDNARFISHSIHSNVEKKGIHLYATQKIEAGVELTMNYLLVCDWVKTHGLKQRKMFHMKQEAPAYQFTAAMRYKH